MNQTSITRRFAGVVLAAALALGGLFAATSVEPSHQSDPTEEVAGGTWSLVSPYGNKGGGQTQGGTWS